ncbi:hypothetical protein DL96DRAFT_1602371 [Flagelloscypha sp. PMI_526]|nr:hypothetical protein DL96DRAFT_1602371 [Flagelloscypha sp. PMI_526]
MNGQQPTASPVYSSSLQSSGDGETGSNDVARGHIRPSAQSTPGVERIEYQSSHPNISQRSRNLYPFARNKPSFTNVVLQQRRVVTFPDSSSQQPMVAVDQSTRRVVSMPESSSHSHLASPGHHDHFDHSFNEAGNSPSPSPNLVSVVNSEEKMFSTGRLDNILTQAVTDTDNGWVDWSPPPCTQPIPALHGPLSLPYARCPSGAEGTIAEGEDLRYAVWGLGNVDCAPLVDFNQPAIAYPQYPTRAEVLDIACPVFPSLRHPMEPPLLLPPPSKTPSIPNDHSPILLENLAPHSNERYNYLHLPPHKPTMPAGLGYSWMGNAMEPDIRELDGHLKNLSLEHPSATADQFSDLKFTPLSQQKPPMDPIRSFPRRLSALEIAQQYRESQVPKIPDSVLRSPPREYSPALTSSDGFSSQNSTPTLPTPQVPEFCPSQNNEDLKRFISAQLGGFEFDADNENRVLSIQDLASFAQARRSLENGGTDLPGPPPKKPSVVTAPPAPGDTRFQSLNFRNRQNFARPQTFSISSRLSSVPEEDTKDAAEPAPSRHISHHSSWRHAGRVSSPTEGQDTKPTQNRSDKFGTHARKSRRTEEKENGSYGRHPNSNASWRKNWRSFASKAPAAT